MAGFDHEYCILIIGDTVNPTEKSQDTSDAKVYLGNFEYAKANRKKCYSLLSKKEQAQADRFRFERDRYLYIAAHGLLREKISEIISISPVEMQFQTSLYGKPYFEDPSISFNISHSRDYFAIIISDGTQVGIDVDGFSNVLDYKSIMRKYYSQNEREFVVQQPEEEQMAAFYLIWTRKEALLKALGIGLIDSLRKLDTLGSLFRIGQLDNSNSIQLNSSYYYLYSKQLDESVVSISGSKPINISFYELPILD